MKTLRVATLNLWNKSGPWPERKELICEDLLRYAPDVVGLQELLRLVPPPELRDPAAPAPHCGLASGGPGEAWGWNADDDQLSELEARLRRAGGREQRLAFVVAKVYGGGLLMGNGLMTRFPLLDVQGFALPGEESGDTRSVLYALVDTPAGQLPVFVTHLNWKLHHGSVRLRQVCALVEHVESLHPFSEEPQGGRLPPVLMGDFNAEPDSDEIRFLRGLHTVQGKSVHFADSWTWAGDGGAGYTFDRANGFAARSKEPPRRIDYVFVRGPDAWLRGEPVAARLGFDEARPSGSSPAGRTWPSDHYGLVVDLGVDEHRASE